MSFATRFAPSPTGLLHRGHAFSALTAHEATRAAGGRFVLRIEDIDFTRCRQEYEAAIYHDLAWLGLTWERPVRRQSEHGADYQSALDRLQGLGVLYRCFRTRKDLAVQALAAPHGRWTADRPGPHDPSEESRLLAEGQPFAWRLSMDRAQALVGPLTFTDDLRGTLPVEPDLAGDIVLTRKDIGVAYHLAAVFDDALQGITHVIRGEDLLEATHPQRILQALLGLPEPRYHHHRLLVGPDGKRYAKRDRSQTLAELRGQGMTAEALKAEIGFAA